jgi:stearoyl-CoA desaturase (delta-9 desaturase)
MELATRSTAPRLTLMSGLFFAMHATCASAFFVPFAWKWVSLAAAGYLVRMFAVTAGFHRYFSHRSYRLGRVPQFCLAVLAQTSAQKGVLWWAANHREHHRHSDEAPDHHSPVRDGLWWSHMGWFLSDAYDEVDESKVADLARFPEIRFISRFHWLCPLAYATATFAIGGWSGFAWGFLVSTVALYHGTFTINSLAHLWGSRPFPTGDGSRNNALLALITLGEGWHNNHHHCPQACRQGLRWYEIDLTWTALRALSLVGLVRDIRPWRAPDAPRPTPRALETAETR